MGSERWSRRRLLGGGGMGLLGLSLSRRSSASPECEGPRGDRAPLDLTLSGGTVLLPTGERLENSGIRVENGVIVEVGSGVKGGRDLAGRWVVPGFIDAGCHVGMYEVGAEGSSRDDQEGLGTVLPDLRVVDGYNPCSEIIPVTRASGVLTAVVVPNGGKLLAGQAAAMHLAGRTLDEVVLQAPVGLCLHLGRSGMGGEGGPSSRLGVGLKLRELLDGIELPDAEADSEEGAGEKRRKKKKVGSHPADEAKPDEDLSSAELALRRLRRGELKALVYADRADDVLRAAELIAEYELDGVIVGGAEAHLVTRDLAREHAGLPFILGPLTVQPASFERLHASYENARVIAEHAPVAFRSGANHFARGLPTDVAVAVSHGLPWEVAVAGLTSTAADVLGLSAVGRLEEGARASFFLCDGDPLQPRHSIDTLVIDGRAVSLDSHQRRLYERFRVLD